MSGATFKDETRRRSRLNISETYLVEAPSWDEWDETMERPEYEDELEDSDDETYENVGYACNSHLGHGHC
ncbi:hypothetical protein F8M41_000076 [Gigaspora margarita]|uniref:Uncharacterized protein n=1 Tax=Gigaspora margarita TaxID=4874 RepID=A0A8H4EW19_GIGMA|nr:hypothetical protein F8M41_000076 [Gigaspora margarita]